MRNIRTKMGEGGRIIIPAMFRQELHINSGDDIILHIENNEIHITTPEYALLKLQKKVKNYLDRTDKPFSLVDELIAERRTEAKNEK